MDEEFVQVYEFQVSFEEFKESVSKSNPNQIEFNMDEASNVSFPINDLLTDNNIFNFNKYEVATPNSFIGITVSDKSPNTQIIVKVYVKKQYEELAIELINSQTEIEEPDELKEYEPIEDEDK